MAEINPLRYRGYYYDAETGFYYLQSRYYDPNTCRFINADGYASTGQGLMGYNMFAYCGNNPIMLSDPSGEFFLTALIVIGVGAFVGAGTGAYIAACDGGDTGDIIEGAIEGGLTGAAAGAIACFVPQTVAIGSYMLPGTLVSGGLGLTAGMFIDAGVQVASYGIRHGTWDGFVYDLGRTIETAVSTALSSMVPVIGDPSNSIFDAAATALVSAEASVLISSATIVCHKVFERGGRGRIISEY